MRVIDVFDCSKATPQLLVAYREDGRFRGSRKTAFAVRRAILRFGFDAAPQRFHNGYVMSRIVERELETEQQNDG